MQELLHNSAFLKVAFLNTTSLKLLTFDVPVKDRFQLMSSFKSIRVKGIGDIILSKCHVVLMIQFANI